MVQNIGLSFDDTWSQLHRDGKSSTGGSLLCWTMDTADGYMVKMTYNGERLFTEPVLEVPRTKEMIEVQTKINHAFVEARDFRKGRI